MLNILSYISPLPSGIIFLPPQWYSLEFSLMRGSFSFCFLNILSLLFWKIVWLSMELWLTSYFLSTQWKYDFTIFWHPLWLLRSHYISNYYSFMDSSLYFLTGFDISLSLVSCGFMMIYQAVDFFLLLCL